MEKKQPPAGNAEKKRRADYGKKRPPALAVKMTNGGSRESNSKQQRAKFEAFTKEHAAEVEQRAEAGETMRTVCLALNASEMGLVKNDMMREAWERGLSRWRAAIERSKTKMALDGCAASMKFLLSSRCESIEEAPRRNLAQQKEFQDKKLQLERERLELAREQVKAAHERGDTSSTMFTDLVKAYALMHANK